MGGLNIMKKTKYIFGALLLLFIGLFVFTPSINDIIKNSVEFFGSKVTKTKVSLKGVDLSIKKGKLELNGFSIMNPKGYSNNSMIELDKIIVDIDTSSITSDIFRIENILVSKPYVLFEMKNGKSNLNAMLDNMAPKKEVQAVKDDEKQSDKDAASNKKLVIKKLDIEKGKIAVSLSQKGDKKLTIPLPEIHMRDIGNKKDGASPQEVATKIIGNITNSAQKIASSSAVVAEQIGKTAEAIKDTANKQLNSIKGLFGN
jgi:hypothetical protein